MKGNNKNAEKAAVDINDVAWGRPPTMPKTDLSRVDPFGQGVASRTFGPGTPIEPVRHEGAPVVFQYKPGVNLTYIPRAGFDCASYKTLRNLGSVCYQVRANVELLKREIKALEWKIVPKDAQEKNNLSQQIDQVTAFFETPDGVQEFDSWLGSVIEDVLVIDALTLWAAGDAAGRVNALEQIDGATIRPLLDVRGKVPRAPVPGYLQVLWGYPTEWYTSENLIYKPMNTSVTSPYGRSPIEDILLMVDLALKRDRFHVSYYTDGNVPEALIGAPQTWTPKQIDDFQQYWDAMVAGNAQKMRRMFLWPTGGSGASMPVYEFKRDDPNSTAVDEWLLRVCCWAFGNSPAEFGLVPGGGLGGAGFAAGMENIQYRSALGPITQWLERLFSKTIIGKLLNAPMLKFSWVGMEPEEDRLQQAQIDQVYVNLGIYDRRYVQDRLGIPQEQRPAQPPATTPLSLPGQTQQPSIFDLLGISPAVPPVQLEAKAAGCGCEDRAEAEAGPTAFFRRHRKQLE